MQPAPPVLVPEMLLGDALDVFMANRCKQLPVVSGHWSPVLLGEVCATICCWRCRTGSSQERARRARAPRADACARL